MTKEQQIQLFLDQLASSASTPGGGGAAAIMGAMGAALVSMVCNLTIGKEKYAAVEDELKAVLDQAENLRARLTDMIQADVEVFDRVMASYGMPKSTAEEKSARSAEIQEALKAATDVPLACAKASAEVIALSRSVAEKGNLNVISDAGVAVLAGFAALKAAALNVKINIGGIKDADFVSNRRKQLLEVLDGCGWNTDEIYQIVERKL
ncbi:MAG: cyclodeaminase/cyclohydrolase family protein [Methylococcaceae bacterium]|nr:cyclodeaminase/cyclohydrolase family protein [Methylococcaceae bacterium]